MLSLGTFVKSCVRSMMSYGSECWAMTPDECRQQKWEWLEWCVERLFVMEFRMACWGLDKTGVKDIQNHLRETEMAWAPWKNE